jgi:septal ring factor EnvC (AmiA/AmiB activator)
MLTAATTVLALLLVYVVFSAYVPATERVVRLETELRQIYAREADLLKRLAEQEERAAALERQVTALEGERARLAAQLVEVLRERATHPAPAAPSEAGQPGPSTR